MMKLFLLREKNPPAYWQILFVLAARIWLAESSAASFCLNVISFLLDIYPLNYF